MSCSICLSLSDSLQLVWEYLVPSVLLRMASLCSFYGWVVSHCVCIHLLNPFIYLWIFPCLGYYEEYGCMYLFQRKVCLDICPGVGLLGHMVFLYLVSWGTSILFSSLHSHQQLYQLTFPPTVKEGSLFSTLSPASVICWLVNSDWCEVVPHCSFDLHFSNN